MKLTTVILFSFVCILSIHADKLKISLFYESLCPGCRNFILTQVNPTYKDLSDYFTLDLVPFGKANYTQENGKWTFTCQHGPNECIGNKYQACALAYGADFNYVYCVENTGDPSNETYVEKCSEESNLSFKDIKNCYDSGEGDTLLVNLGNRTKSLNPPLKWVPSVWFNDVYNDTLDDDAFGDLENVVCSLLDPKPDKCNQ